MKNQYLVAIGIVLISLLGLPFKARGMDWSEFDHTVGLSIETSQGLSVCSGILVSSQVVLTAAHCLINWQRIQVTTDFLMNPDSFILASRTEIHPDYKGNALGSTIDLGLIFLSEALPWVEESFFWGEAGGISRLERIGFGGREEENRRTWVELELKADLGIYLEVMDEFGVSGDSGGPVFQRTNDHELRLIGIHTGRKLDQNGLLLPISLVQRIRFREQQWIQSWIDFSQASRQ